jgi:hypothetical protein
METNLAPEWYAFCCGTAPYTSGDRLYAGVYAYTGTVYDIFIRGTHHHHQHHHHSPHQRRLRRSPCV